MEQALSSFIQTLVSEEIRRIVAEAIQDGGMVSSPSVAALINRTYPNSGLTERQIADEVMIAAARSGIAVEIGRGDRPTTVDGQSSPSGKSPTNGSGNEIGPSRQ